MKKIILQPYFGDFPFWMNLYEPPKGFDWILDTNIEKFKERVWNKLEIEYTGTYGSGKLHDYRGALGLLYEEEIKGYDFWTTVDFDVVWGDINKFYPDSMLEQYDVISGHNEYVNGCFSLYRNCKEVNELFLRCPNWKENMSHAESNGWIEMEYSRILEKSGLRYKYTFEQGWPWTKEPILKKEGDSLFQLINNEWKEIAFFHFRHSKKWPLNDAEQIESEKYELYMKLKRMSYKHSYVPQQPNKQGTNDYAFHPDNFTDYINEIIDTVIYHD